MIGKVLSKQYPVLGNQLNNGRTHTACRVLFTFCCGKVTLYFAKSDDACNTGRVQRVPTRCCIWRDSEVAPPGIVLGLANSDSQKNTGLP